MSRLDTIKAAFDQAYLDAYGINGQIHWKMVDMNNFWKQFANAN